MDLRAERAALTWSIVVSVAIGVLALAWGVWANSRVLVFDGVYTLLGIILSALSLAASRTAASEPTEDYPFGLRAVTPLAIAVQGAALLGTLGYAGVDAVLVIAAGGAEVDPVTVLIYGSVTAVAAGTVAVWLRRRARVVHSDLVRTEAAGWLAGAVLSLVFALGGLIAFLLRDHSPTVVRFADPVLVLLVCVGLLPLPLRLLRDASRELLEAAPSRDVRDRIDAAVVQVRDDFGLDRVHTRSTKLGGRLYVEVDFVVEPGRWEVDEEDRVRRALLERLAALDYDVWATIELTTDPLLAE